MANKTAEPVNISFHKLNKLLESQGKKWQYLRDCGISPGIVAKMKDSSGHTDTRTIQKVCMLLNCQPGDIMEYIPNYAESSHAAPGSQLKPEPPLTTSENQPATIAHEQHYKSFTEADANRIDLSELLSNIRYQLDIGETFGMDVLSVLMEKARQQEAEKETTPIIPNILGKI